MTTTTGEMLRTLANIADSVEGEMPLHGSWFAWDLSDADQKMLGDWLREMGATEERFRVGRRGAGTLKLPFAPHLAIHVEEPALSTPAPRPIGPYSTPDHAA
jgi:hypothetical protein